MNKVFKVIWNHATQTWTAVSELGHAKGKTKSKKIVKLTALAGAVLGVVGTAQAAVDVDSSSITIASNHPTANEATKGKQNINIGTGANTYRSANGKVSHDAIAIGSNATGTGDAAVAIGLEASATEQNGVAIGHKAKNTSQSSVAIGENATSSKDMDVAVGKGAAASGGESLAFGSEANSSAKAAISVGKSSVAAGDSAVATGYLANAGAANTVATGKSATASVDNAVAVGVQTNASARNAMALGGYSSASGERATAVGAASKASGTASFAGGTSANASGTNSVAIGGSMTPADAAQATGANTTAIGTGAKAEKDNAVALGSGSTTSDFVPTSSATVGTLTYSGFAGSNSSLGNGAVVSVGGPVTPTNQLGSARQIQNVAAGRIDAASTDAVNGSQLYVVASKLDEKIHNHHWIASGNQTAGAQHANTSIYNNGVVDFQNGNGTIATVTNETLDQSTGTKKTVVKYHANIVAGDNTTVDYNADGSVKISANVSGGTDTTAKVITGSPNALIVTNTTTDNVTTYNVSVKTGDISTTTAGAATYDKDGDNAASGNYGSRLTNVSTVTNIVNNVSWHLNSEAVPGTSGTLITGSDTEASNVRASNTVNINAGDNIAIKRNGNTIEISSTGGAKGDTGATGAKGDTGAAGAKGDTGAAGAKGDTGDSITGEVVDNGDGTHTITITNLGDGSVTTTIVKDGKDGKNGKDGATGAAGKNAEASVVNNGNGTHTVTIVDGNGQTTSTVVKDGKNAEASVTNNGNGTHTLTVVDGNGNTTTTIVKDGATGAAGAKGDTGATGEKGDKGDSITGEVVDNGDGTHTITITDLGTGSVTTTIVKDGKDGKDGATGATGADGKNAEADVKDNGDGTHTVTIKDGNGNTTTTIVKDGKNAEADVKDNGDGTHTVTIKDGNGNTTTAIIKDGATGAKGDTGATGADGKNAEADVKDNGDGTHTVTIKDGNGNTTTTIIKDGATGAKGDTGADGKNAEADVKDNGDGTHTVTIKDGNGNTTTTIIKDGATGAKGEKGDTGATGADGKNAEADVKDNGDGTHTVTIKDGNGNTTTTIVKDGATGAKGDKGDKGEDGTSITGEVVDNGDGTHTITITDLGTGSVTTTIVKDGKDGATGATGATGADGKNAEADVKDNGDGTHTVTIKDGNGNTTTTIVKDGKNGKDGVMTWDIKSTGNTTEGSADTAKTIKHTNTVDMAAGKNLTVNQTNNSDGAKVEFALNSTVTNLDKVVVNGKDGVDGKDGVTITAPVEAKDGKDGSDGKVGISGKDGKDAVSISGKDGVGQIGLTGPKGKDGKDGASINITTDNGKQTLVNREVGADGKPGETTQRIIYVPTDKDGNPLKDENGKTIKREVATMDDGLIFGGNTGEAHKAALGTQVNVKGADANTDWNKFDAGQNIMTKVDTATKTITVGLAKDLNVDNVDVKNNVTAKGTISAPTFKAGDTTINNGVVTNLTHHIDNPTTVVDDKVLNITDEKKKEAATVRDVLNSGWNLQANGKPVDAVTHGNNVNFASDKGTVTVKANSDGKTSVVNLDVNVDNDTITVNNKGQLVANGATNFNVATKDGGNKVAKKGGSSTAKITSGKTITYTAGKNIAIEQNGGEILVSTTNDVDHNSVTTNNLTVNKGGNIDMGGNQIHNVKAGTKDTDAVNVSQLKQSIGDVHKRINKVGKEARGGIAGANAAAGLPQVYIPGKSMVAASAGTFKGESAVAVGYSRSSDNGKVIFKLQGNANTQGDVGGSVGVGYQW